MIIQMILCTVLGKNMEYAGEVIELCSYEIIAKSMVITKEILDELTAKAKENPRLRCNLDLRNSADDQSQRMLNALEPGTVMPIHRHPTKDESFVILRGKVRSTTYNDDGSIIDSVVLSQDNGVYGVDIPKPGVSKVGASDEILTLLGVTDSYLKDKTGIDLRVITNEYSFSCFN